MVRQTRQKLSSHPPASTLQGFRIKVCSTTPRGKLSQGLTLTLAALHLAGLSKSHLMPQNTKIMYVPPPLALK